MLDATTALVLLVIVLTADMVLLMVIAGLLVKLLRRTWQASDPRLRP